MNITASSQPDTDLISAFICMLILTVSIHKNINVT